MPIPLEVIPAIDIRGGKCVRLYQGDFARETVFSEDPVEVARRWQECGASRLHVVDLDGAAVGQPVNTESIREILRAASAPVQVGGGLRTLEAIAAMLEMGADRVVLGTAAAEEPSLMEEACCRFGDAIVAGIDARNGLVATHGWKRSQRLTAIDLLHEMERLGVQRVVYTDIDRDGVLTGPNLQAVGELLKSSSAKVIAAGGVSSLEDLAALARLGVEGTIIGQALYTGDVDLKEAIALAPRGFTRE